MIEHRWLLAQPCLDLTLTLGALSNYLKLRTKLTIPQAATSILLDITRLLTTTSLGSRAALSTFLQLLIQVPQASLQVLIPHLVGVHPQTSSPLGCPMNNSGLLYSLWLALVTLANTWIISLK